MLTTTQDMDAAQRFFRQARGVADHLPERVTTEGHSSYPRAIDESLGVQVNHRCIQYFINCLEQDHRGLKQRYHPMRGFDSFEAQLACVGPLMELLQFERYRRARAGKGQWRNDGNRLWLE